MNEKPIKAIVWDLDGTLIHFKINSIKARRNAFKILKNYRVPKKALSIDMSILKAIKISRQFFIDFGFSSEEIKKIIEEVNMAIIEVEHEAAIKATLIKGIAEVLEFAQKKNLIQAIFTYNTHKNASTSLKAAGITHYFDVIAGRDDIKTLKPHPDHLKYVCEKINVQLDEIVIIGDSGRDIEAALLTNSRSIALTTKIPSFIKREAFKKADKIIEPADLPHELIKTLEDFL